MITRKAHQPGFGDHAVIRNPVTGTEWIVEVLYWGVIGSPFATDLHTAERRWFPPHWVVEIESGPGPRPCSCPVMTPLDDTHTLVQRDPDCDVHLSDARRKALTR